MLLYFEDETARAQELAAAAKMPCACIQRHVFPDGEIKLRLPDALPTRVVLFRSLHNPNQKLVELLLAANTARSLGAQHLVLVAPYLAYMRQDIAFHPGEAVSQRIVGQFLAGLFDAVITADPHLHRVATLQEAIPVAANNAIVLSGAMPLAQLIATKRTNPLLVGPDEESAQWVGGAAQAHGFNYAVCRKVRHGDRDVRVELPAMNFAGRQIVLMDDVVSTGHTIAQTTRLLLAAGATSVDVAVTHALFAGDAEAVMRNSGVSDLWSTDCIPHPSNAVSMAPYLAKALQPFLDYPSQ